MSEATPHASPRLAPELRGFRRLLDWVRRRLFDGPVNIGLTVLAVWLVVRLLPAALDWGLFDARFRVSGPAECRAASGACWAVIAEKWRVMLFGTYSYDQHWRPGLVSAVLVGLCFATAAIPGRTRLLAAGWVVGGALSLLLMHGGVAGLSPVPTEQWGGLPLTLILFVGSVAGGMPLALLLALGRRGTLPIIRVACATYIELLRGIPLVNVLFLASLMIPLFLPPGMTVDKLLRALLGMALFFAAYAAEGVRGGLQSVPAGQAEAARALGFGYWGVQRRVVLPQALTAALPPLLNDVIRAFKNTSFVLVIGLFDLLGATSASMSEPVWSRFYVEAYLFVALIYLTGCTAMSRYGDAVERRLRR